MTSPPQELPRRLTLLDSTMINIGSMVGSGIFIVPSVIASELHSTSLVILVWTLGGIVSLFGALSVAELGSIMPRAGGQYVFLTEAYGPFWGFLYGWTAFTVIMSASIAAVAVGFATYLGYFFHYDDAGTKVIAISSILFLTIINCVGTRWGAMVQNGVTILKIFALAALAVLGFVLDGGSGANLIPLFPSTSFATLIGPLSAAMVAVLWSYDGWIEITMVAGEVRHPEHNIHRSLILSTIVVIVIYCVINLAFIYVLSLKTMSRSELVASEAAKVILGQQGASFVALAVILSTFGANNGFVFTGARIYYAMAKEGLFFRSLSKIHRGFQTPVASLLAQGMWASFLVLTGTFEQLITYVVFASWIFYGMSCGGVIILRKRPGSALTPYRTWGYPCTPILFVLFSTGLVLSTIIGNPRDAALGACMIASGIPAYYYWTWTRARE